jgi:tripartite-type tricarboxylate transporter receptor subunit TctC
LKTFGIRNKVEAEVESHNKNILNKQLMKTMFEDRMNAFKTKEQSSRRKKHEEYIKRQRDREQRLK